MFQCVEVTPTKCGGGRLKIGGITGNMAAITALVSREKLAHVVEKNPSCPNGCSTWAPLGLMLVSEK